MGRGSGTIGGSRDRSNCNYGLAQQECPALEDFCCSTSPCCLCLRLTTPEGEVTNVEACRIENSAEIAHGQGRPEYTATINEVIYRLKWEVDANDNCVLVVYKAGEEVARYGKCGVTDADYEIEIDGLQSCNSPEGEVTLYNDDVLEWWTYLQPRRQTIKSDSCEEVPCTQCTCLCERLCVVWRRDKGQSTTEQTSCQYCTAECTAVLTEIVLDEDCIEGEVRWGPIIFEPDCSDDPGVTSIYVELQTDPYCQLVLVVDGNEVDTVEVDALGAECEDVSLSGSYVDEEGCTVTVSVECKKCGDPCFPSNTCGKGCCFTDIHCFEGGNHIDTIPFTLSGPNIPVSLEGDFAEVGNLGSVPCGRCGCLADTVNLLQVFGQLCDPDAQPGGLATPCSFTFFFGLSCEGVDNLSGDVEEEANYDNIDPCAERLRLLIGTDSELFTGAGTPFASTTKDTGSCLGFKGPTPFVSIPFDELSCTPDGLTGSVDLSNVILHECEDGQYVLCESPPNAEEMFSEQCCDLDYRQPFDGAVLTLLPVE